LQEDAVDKARNLLQEGKAEEAISILEPLVELDDEDVDVLAILGIAYVQAEVCDRAIEVLEKADNLAEDHCVVKMFLGRALLAEGRFDVAQMYIREAIELDATEPAAWADLGRVYYRRREYREALAVLEDANRRFPNDVSVAALYALTLYRLGDYTAATEQWAHVHRLHPTLMAAISNYAYLLLVQDRSFEAAPFVGAANTLDPEDYRSKILLGELRFKSGDIDGATEAFLEVLEQDSENVEALAKLALIMHQARNEEMSRHYLSRAEMQLGDDPESWRGLCSIYPLLGMQREYLDCLLSWSEADSGSPTPWVHLAVEYGRRGMEELAREAWIKAFELRGYVKLRCPACACEDRRPYGPSMEFDPFSVVSCSHCGEPIKMPVGLG
jgi:Flp pilus assembly protein TadD